jgi:hypothetical protein
MSINSVRIIILCSLVAGVVFNAAPAWAQRGVSQPEFYPERIYPGENIITITSERGIERIVTAGSRFTTVSVPKIQECPKSVNVGVTVRRATTNEQVEFTVFDCDGRFTTHTISAENWTVREEFTGNIVVGKDTCLDCRIESGEGKLVDSIVVSDPRMHVEMPAPSNGPWQVQGGVDFHYRVCYRATEVDTSRESIRLYIRRQYPNGGLTHYVIEKPILAVGVLPPPPKEQPKPRPRLPELPPLRDPTTFRNILMPTAEPVERGRFFVGTYDLAGWLAGYGVTERLTLMVGGAFVPEFISQLAMGTVGAKFEALHSDMLQGAVGFQYGYSSTAESDIAASTPYAVLSLGDHEQRISLAAGYTWKRHTLASTKEVFDRNAAVVAIGGDLTVARGWKIAAETYFIESSGIAPVAVTVRRFGEHFAVDLGVGIDVSHVGSVTGTGTLSGEIRDLRIAPILSAIWVW